jgi:hypothetical protein
MKITSALRVLTKDGSETDDDEGRQGKVLRIEVFNRPEALSAPVQEFLDRAERRNVGFGLAWYRNLVETVYPNDGGVRFYVLWNAERIIAVLPLHARKIKGAWKIGALSNFYTTLYEPILEPGVESAELAEILSAVQRDFPRFASLTLSPMDSAGDAYQSMLGAMRLKAWMPYEYFAFGNWYQPVAGDWTAYLAARNGTLRSTIKRMSKKLAADGGRLEIVADAKDVPAAIAAYNEVYAASWKRPEEFPEFMPGLLKICAEKGFLRLGLAWLNGRPIAAQLWIVAYGRAEIYKVAYHDGFKAYAPGTLVTALLMQHVFEIDRVSEVDYLIGDDPYKKTWMGARRERCGIVAYNPRSLHGLAGICYESLGRAVKAVKNWFRKQRASETP